jgi:hypothetical protein
LSYLHHTGIRYCPEDKTRTSRQAVGRDARPSHGARVRKPEPARGQSFK